MNIFKGYKNISKLKNVKDLRKLESVSKDNLVKKREFIKICVLDDEGFDTSQLNSVGYTQVKRREVFDDIKDYEEYHIVLCDVDGIGHKFDQEKQGLAVAEQISKSFFPKTIVAIYSGKDLGDYNYKENENITTIEKNIQSSVLIDKIDSIAKSFWSPSIMWSHLEKIFRNNNLPNIDIALLEDGYVKSIINNNNKFFEKSISGRIVNNSDSLRKYIELGGTIINMIIGIYNATKGI